MNRRQNSRYPLLPLAIIEAASKGDADAIHAVLKHYERYISVLSKRTIYDENGTPHIWVNEEMCKLLKIKLIAKILSFELVRTA